MDQINKEFWKKVYLLKGKYFDDLPDSMMEKVYDRNIMYITKGDDYSLETFGYVEVVSEENYIFTDKFINEIMEEE